MIKGGKKVEHSRGKKRAKKFITIKKKKTYEKTWEIKNLDSKSLDSLLFKFRSTKLKVKLQ